MEVLKLLLLIGLFTSTNGIWCTANCTSKVDVHCGDSRFSKCEYKGINYCMVKIQECARMQRGFPRFNYVVRGNCFYNRPPCPEFERIPGPPSKPKPQPKPEDYDLSSSEELPYPWY